MCWSTKRCWIWLTCSKCTYPISKKNYFSNAEHKDWKMVNRLPNHCVILSDEWWLHKLRCWCEYWQSCLEGKQIWLTKHHNQVSYLIHGVIHHWFNVATKLRWPPSNLDLEKQRYHVNWKKIWVMSPYSLSQHTKGPATVLVDRELFRTKHHYWDIFNITCFYLCNGHARICKIYCGHTELISFVNLFEVRHVGDWSTVLFREIYLAGSVVITWTKTNQQTKQQQFDWWSREYKRCY